MLGVDACSLGRIEVTRSPNCSRKCGERSDGGSFNADHNLTLMRNCRVKKALKYRGQGRSINSVALKRILFFSRQNTTLLRVAMRFGGIKLPLVAGGFGRGNGGASSCFEIQIHGMIGRLSSGPAVQ